MVARWHDAAQASSLMQRDTWRASEVLRSVADLIRYGEDPENHSRLLRDFHCYDRHRRWDAIRARLFEIEGIEPSPFAEGRLQAAPRS